MQYILPAILVVLGTPLIFGGVAMEDTLLGTLISLMGIGVWIASYLLALRANTKRGGW